MARGFNTAEAFRKAHACKRFNDHYGFDPTADEWNTAIAAIRERRALLVAKQPDGNEIWAVEIRGHSVRLIWNPARGILITTVPPERRSLRKQANA